MAIDLTGQDQKLSSMVNVWMAKNTAPAILGNNAVFFQMMKKGNVRTGGFGGQLIEPLRVPRADGPQVTGVTSGYTPVQQQEMTGITHSEWKMAEYYEPVSIEMYDVDQLKSPAGMLDWVQEVLLNARDRFVTRLNQDFWAAEGAVGAAGNQRNALGSIRAYINGGGGSTTDGGANPPALSGQLVAAVGTTPITKVGAIERNAAGAAYWCPFLFNPGPAANLSLRILNNMITRATRNSDKPDLMIHHPDQYDLLMSILQGYQRWDGNADSKIAGVGFEGIKYRSVTILFDDSVPIISGAYQAFCLNTQYLKLRCKSMKPETMKHDDQRPLRVWSMRMLLQMTSGWLGRCHSRHCNLAAPP